MLIIKRELAFPGLRGFAIADQSLREVSIPATMAYLAPIHCGTSVRHAIKLNLLSPDEESLVLA